MGRHLKNGAVVEYTVKPVYMNPMSLRPDWFIIEYKTNDVKFWKKVKND